MRGIAGSVCDVPMIELRKTANMIQKYNALNPIQYASILAKVAGWSPEVNDFVRIMAMIMFPMKNPWATRMGKKFVDRSAASAFAFKIQC